MFKCRLPDFFLTICPLPFTRNRFLTLLFVLTAIPREGAAVTSIALRDAGTAASAAATDTVADTCRQETEASAAATRLTMRAAMPVARGFVGARV